MYLNIDLHILMDDAIAGYFRTFSWTYISAIPFGKNNYQDDQKFKWIYEIGKANQFLFFNDIYTIK